MSEYMFGTGPGHLPSKADRIARTHGASLVNYTEWGCMCGHNCPPRTCRRSRRHWFVTRNQGSPFNENTAREVLAALKSANVVD